ncbi:TonB-dependent receptor [Arachidicoccus ginsenosidivorans]
MTNSKKLPFLLGLFLSVVFCGLAAAQGGKTITGVVLSQDQTALAGVSVSVPQSSTGTITDDKGAFSLQVPTTMTSLSFSFIGYLTQVAPIGANNQINIILIRDSSSNLGDVVVIGYGSVDKKDVTGAIATISTKDFQKGSITSFDQMIAGKAPGISITSNGGHPGSGSTIRIRGLSSLSAGQDPLQVVDGAPFSGYVNPNDIESVTILKDAASAAIYGSRASGGVILITTKKGRLGQTKVNFNNQFSLSQVKDYVDVLTADQFRDFVNSSSFFNEEAKSLMGTANTNWQKEIYRTAVTSNNNISLSGGIGKIPYRLSVGYLNQAGILKTDNMGRTTGSLSLTPTLWQNHLKITLNLNGSVTRNRNANQGAIGAAIAFDPTQSVYDGTDHTFGNYYEWVRADGTPNPLAAFNPVSMLSQRTDISHYNRGFGNINVDYSLHFLPDLHVSANLGFDVGNSTGTTKEQPTSRNTYNLQSSTVYKGLNNQYSSDFNNYFAEYMLNYKKDITSIKSNINAILLYGYYDDRSVTDNYASYDYFNREIPNSQPKYPDSLKQNTLISYVGRLIYTYDNKYTLTASLRRDGSSKFAPDTRWGWFPSVALGWNLKKEGWFGDASALSSLKLRGSYGITGNQSGIDNYRFIPTYYLSDNVSNYQFGDNFYSMYTPSSYDESLKWEKTASANIGLDFGFFDQRIFGSVDVYNKHTTDLLAVVNIPAGTNFTNQLLTNIGSMTSKGAELNLGFVPVRSNDVEWTVNLNAAYNNSKITKLLANADSSFKGQPVGGIEGATGQTIQIQNMQQEPNAFLVYKQVYDANGKPIEGAYEDLNGDGQINPYDDQYSYKSPWPKWVLGFSTNLRYKKWNFSTTLRANIGNYMYNNIASNQGIAYNMSVNQYLANAVTDVLYTRFINKQQQSDYYVQNASFLKMDNIGITYNVGQVLKYKNTDLSLSAHVQNVLCITKYDGLDPEIYGGIDQNIYPNPRVYTIGLNLNF